MKARPDKLLKAPLKQFSRIKQGIALVILALAFIMASIFIALPRNQAAHATGSPTLTLTPSSNSYASTSSIKAKGSNFAVSESVKVYWNYTGPGTGTLESTVTSDATGAFTTSFKIPLAPTGTYVVAAVGTSDSAQANFQLLPELYPVPRAAGVATNLTLYGNAFGAGESVNIYWNYTGPGTGTLLSTTTANTTGSFIVKAPVPNGATPGRIPIGAVGQTTNTTSTYKFYLYPPTLALAPLSGSAGTLLTLSAYGFQGNESVNIYWNGSSTPIGAAGTTNQFGYMAPTTFTIPSGTAPGAYSVKAVGSVTNLSITNTFTVVVPGSSLSLTSGPVGATVKVTGQGYAPNETVNLLWNYTGPGTGTMVDSVVAGISGTISGSFIVPIAANGAYPVAAIGTTSNSVTQNTYTLGNGIVSSMPTASPNSNVTIAGTGFTAGESVSLYWNTVGGISLGTATADTLGNISQSITIPNSARHGVRGVIAVGQTSKVSFTATVTVDTSWGDFGYSFAHHRQNIYENTLNTTNVGSLKLKWTSTPTATNLESSPVYANGIVYLTTSDGKLNAYDAATGVMKWQFDSLTGFENFSAPVVDTSTGMVFFGTIGHDYPGIPSPSYGLNAQTGTLVWSLILPWNEFGFPSVAFGTIYVGTANESASASIFALDEVSGHVVWQYVTTGSVWGAVAIDISTKTVFTGMGNPGNAVLALNAFTGVLVWQYNVPNSPGDLDVGAGIDIANGLVYASSKNGNVYALHETNGTLAWTATINTGIDDVSAPAYTSKGGTQGTIYVGSLDNNLYSLDAATGAINWKFNFGGPIWSSPAIANGIVYFSTGATNQTFYAINAATGATLWSYKTGAVNFSSPIVVNGWFYCGSTNGNLYAFGL